MSRPWKRRLAAVAALAAVALAAGCSGGGSLTSGRGGGGGAAPVGSTPGGGGAPTSGERGPAGGNRTVVETKAVIKTGDISLTSAHPDQARAEIDRLLDALGGSVDSEQTSHADDGTIEHSTLVLRVPVAKFESAVDALERIGTMKTSDSSSEDVTTKVIDVAERVRTLRTSLSRLHKFQRQSTNIDDLLRFEQEITDRESELQSLTAQRDYLADQTSMATITVYLSTPAKYVAPPDALRDAGFLTGLRAGWHALVDTVVVVLTVVGAVLPFGVVLGLVGIPVALLVRRLVRARRTEAAGRRGG